MCGALRDTTYLKSDIVQCKCLNCSLFTIPIAAYIAQMRLGCQSPIALSERIPLAAITQHQISDLMGSQKKFGFPSSLFSLLLRTQNTS